VRDIDEILPIARAASDMIITGWTTRVSSPVPRRGQATGRGVVWARQRFFLYIAGWNTRQKISPPDQGVQPVQGGNHPPGTLVLVQRPACAEMIHAAVRQSPFHAASIVPALFLMKTAAFPYQAADVFVYPSLYEASAFPHWRRCGALSGAISRRVRWDEIVGEAAARGLPKTSTPEIPDGTPGRRRTCASICAPRVETCGEIRLEPTARELWRCTIRRPVR